MALTPLDRNLLRQCLSQSPGAWEDFVDRFIGLFLHVINHTAHARSVVLSPADVEDLCGEIFLALLNDDSAILRKFRGESSLATYLTVVSRRIVVREIMRRRRSEALGHVDAHQAAVEGALRDGADHQRIEDAEEVERMLRGLSRRDAAIVRQFHLEGKSYQEISHSLRVPENTIGPTLTRARERLKNAQLKSGV